jgi:hypothetical protein
MDRLTGTGQEAMVLCCPVPGKRPRSYELRDGATISRQCAQLRSSGADPPFWYGQGPARDFRERRPEDEGE